MLMSGQHAASVGNIIYTFQTITHIIVEDQSGMHHIVLVVIALG